MEAEKFLEEQDIFDIVPDGPAKFESAEHDALAAACTLRWPNGVTSTGGDPNFPLKSVPLTGKDHKGKSYEITFNKVVPIAGDFFTTFDYLPISYGTLGTGQEEQEKDTTLKGPKTTMKGRFRQALDLLTQDAVGTLGPVLDKLDADAHVADEIHDHGHQHASQVYGGTDTTGSTFTTNMSWAWAMFSGGWSHYLTSLAMNMDHFGVWAQDVYTIGHSIALDLAESGREKAPDGKVRSSCERLTALQEAYLAEAFAAHYMTDLFAAGHLRASRREFHKTPSFKAVSGGAIGFLGSLVDIPVIDDVAYDLFGGQTKDTWDMQVNKFHENDGTAGLLVRNAKGERWIAYGDKQFFSPVNRVSRLRSVAACQAGVDEVFDVWSGKKSKPAPVFARENRPQDMYEALKQSPLPSEYLASEDGPWNGTTARLWQVVVTGQTEAWDDAKADAAVADGKYSRRVDVNDMDNYAMKLKANPGWKYAASSIGSDDVLEIINDSFIGKKEAFPPVPMTEMLSGGFLQIQEYKDRIFPDSKLDHALNFWGPANFAITGEPQDKPQPSFNLRRRWDSITYPNEIGRIQGDQTTLHWLTHTRSGIYTDVIRVFHRESDKSINVNMYTFTSAKDQNDPAGLSEVKPGGLPLFPEAGLEIGYNLRIWHQDKLSLRDCGSMRFLNFYKSAPGDNPKNRPRKHNQIVGFRTFTREVRDAKGAKSNRMEYEPVFLFHRMFDVSPSKGGFACKVLPLRAWDDSDGLTTPDFLKTYQNVDGQDQALLVIRRLGTSGTSKYDKEMDVEIRCYRWDYITKNLGGPGVEIPKEAGKAHPCCSIYKVKIKAPANFTGPLSDPGAWQVLVDDFRNCGRPELVFLVGKEIGEYSIQVYGFDGESLVERNIGIVPPIPKELPAYSWMVSNVGRHHFTAFCPSETIPWTHDIVQVSDYLWYGKTDPLRLRTPNRYLYFRTWIKGDQTPPASGIPQEWKDRPSRVEYHWQSQEFDSQPCATAQKIPKKEPISSSAPAIGWNNVVDGLVYDSAGNVVVDEFSMNKYFFSIKWTRCAVKIPVDPKATGTNVAKVTTTRGLQEVFSYYGVLGIRVFAPITKGDYSKWQLVVQVPFLGQTSRGTGKTAGGSWNSAGILPWGTANEFGDVNTWTRGENSWKHFNAGDSWDKLEHGYGTKGKPYQFKQ